MIEVRDYLREAAMPHVLCPGCAHGIVLRAFIEAVGALALDRDRVAVVAGIGCSSRLAGHVDCCTLHATHGRAPAFATGIKLARPDMTVVVFTGDGDGLAIGGNHLIHAARRNIDLTCLLFNNAIYGMTGGQLAPTTPQGALASTAPFGNVEPPFDACRLMEAAGATFVARVVAYEPIVLSRVIREGLAHRGFSFVEVVSDCPVYYGRYNQEGQGPEMLAGMKRHDAAVAGILGGKAFVPDLPASPVETTFPTGVLHRAERPEFAELCRRLGGRCRPEAADIEEGSSRRTEVSMPEARAVPAVEVGAPGGGRVEIRLAGSGGQGVVLAGVILAEAAILSGRNVAQSQAYGPESRGGASRSDVVIASGDLGFPKAQRLDVLVALDQAACERNCAGLRSSGLLLVDDRLVPDPPAGTWTWRSLPITDTARAVTGSDLAANIVALGALAGLTGIVGTDALGRAVERRVPSGSRAINQRALAAGIQLAVDGGE